MDKKRKAPLHEMKDREVPPVKGAVTDLEDIVRRPAAMFGPAHPAEQLDRTNSAVFEEMQ